MYPPGIADWLAEQHVVRCTYLGLCSVRQVQDVYLQARNAAPAQVVAADHEVDLSIAQSSVVLAGVEVEAGKLRVTATLKSAVQVVLGAANRAEVF